VRRCPGERQCSAVGADGGEEALLKADDEGAGVVPDGEVGGEMGPADGDDAAARGAVVLVHRGAGQDGADILLPQAAPDHGPAVGVQEGPDGDVGGEAAGGRTEGHRDLGGAGPQPGLAGAGGQDPLRLAQDAAALVPDMDIVKKA
jgi:hypothetical protein